MENNFNDLYDMIEENNDLYTSGNDVYANMYANLNNDNNLSENSLNITMANIKLSQYRLYMIQSPGAKLFVI